VSGPLAGIRIVDLSGVVSGPACTAMLADQGADVIKVETPAGDQMRRGKASPQGLAPGFISCNRGKRSIALDLKRQPACDVLWRLVERADVLVQNFRPGTIERLGFAEPEVRKHNPRIVYLSISGVGEQGPYSTARVYDPIVQALSGLADIQADPTTGRPRMVRTIVADKTTAVYAAQALTAALLHRERSGEGQHVRVSMLDAMVSYLWPEGMAAYTRVDDGDEAPRSSVHDMIFETADGYITVGTVSDAEWSGLCTALGKPGWLQDPRFTTTALRSTHREERLALVAEVLRTRGRQHWLDLLQDADVPSAPVLRRRELMDHAQVRANGLIHEFHHPHAGNVRQARPAARFERSPAGLPGPAPRLGEQSRAILEEAGYDARAIEALITSGAVAATAD